jgi:hypothetical protein
MYMKDEIDYNQRGTLVKEISHIKFPALTLLHLEGN